MFAERREGKEENLSESTRCWPDGEWYVVAGVAGCYEAKTLAEPARQGEHDHKRKKKDVVVELRAREEASPFEGVRMFHSRSRAETAASRRGVVYFASYDQTGQWFVLARLLLSCVHVVLIFPVCNATPHIRCGLVCVCVLCV